MKTIFKGNPFSIVWNIIDRSTNHPFEFTGIKVEVGLYSDSFNFPLQSYNVNNGTITAGIESNTLPAGVFNIMCRYSTDHEQSYCTYRNAFQISSRPFHASEIVEIESYASHIDPSSEVPDAPDYCKCQLIAEELFGVKLHLPVLTADRSIADEHGNRIPDTYVTRQGLTEHIKNTYNQQFLENPPLITEGYITPGMLSEETRQMLEATGQEITNLPDGEDLNTVHGVLKLANKEYNPNSYSGMGRVYLRKNIVAGRNVLTQSMINKPNTIYIIQYDYDLQGAEITIPENCVLDFQGGSLNDGTINGNITIIKSLPVGIFNSNITLAGTWNVSEAYPEWFGAKGDNVHNDAPAIQMCLDLFSVTLLQDRTYKIERTDNDLDYVLSIKSNRSLRGSTFVHKTEHHGTLSCGDKEVKRILSIDGGGIELCNFSVIAPQYENKINTIKDLKDCQCVIATTGNHSKLTFHNVKTQFGEIGFNIQAWMVKMSQCFAFNNTVGFYIHGMLDDEGNIVGENTTIRMDNCYAIISTWHAFYFKGIDYSSFNNLAADGCGHYFQPINSWDDVRAPYYFDGVKACCFTTLGAEACLKMIRIQGSVRNTIINPFIYYSFHTNDLKGGAYTPGHVFEYVSCTDLRIFGVNLSIPDTALQLMVKDNPNAPLYYISDSIERDTGWLSVSCYSVGDAWRNYALGGTMKKESIRLYDRTYRDSFNFSADSLTNILLSEEVDVKNNPNTHIVIETGHTGEIGFGLYGTKTLDLNGKTIEVIGNQQLSAYGQAGHLVVKNGTFILRGFTIRDTSNTKRSCYIKAENAKVVLDECSVFELEGDYIVDCDEYSEAEFINYNFTPVVKAGAQPNRYKAYLTAIPSLAYRIILDKTIMALDYEYISHGTGQTPKFELVDKYVEDLPSAQDSEHGGSAIITGMMACHNGTWKVYNGGDWVNI